MAERSILSYFEPPPPPDPHQLWDAALIEGLRVSMQGLGYASVGAGQLFVVNGATCACSVGTRPTTLSVPCLNAAAGSPADAANIEIRTFSGTFGFCNNGKHPPNTVPCKPVTPCEWQPGAGAATIGGAPALLAGDLLECTKGGIIKITNPGQGSATYEPSAPASNVAFVGPDGRVIITAYPPGQVQQGLQQLRVGIAWQEFNQAVDNLLSNPLTSIAGAFGKAAENASGAEDAPPLGPGSSPAVY